MKFTCQRTKIPMPPIALNQLWHVLILLGSIHTPRMCHLWRIRLIRVLSLTPPFMEGELGSPAVSSLSPLGGGGGGCGLRRVSPPPRGGGGGGGGGAKSCPNLPMMSLFQHGSHRI